MAAPAAPFPFVLFPVLAVLISVPARAALAVLASLA